MTTPGAKGFPEFVPPHSFIRRDLDGAEQASIDAWLEANDPTMDAPGLLMGKERSCVHCGEPFKPITHNMRYCGSECREASQ